MCPSLGRNVKLRLRSQQVAKPRKVCGETGHVVVAPVLQGSCDVWHDLFLGGEEVGRAGLRYLDVFDPFVVCVGGLGDPARDQKFGDNFRNGGLACVYGAGDLGDFLGLFASGQMGQHGELQRG